MCLGCSWKTGLLGMWWAAWLSQNNGDGPREVTSSSFNCQQSQRTLLTVEAMDRYSTSRTNKKLHIGFMFSTIQENLLEVVSNRFWIFSYTGIPTSQNQNTPWDYNLHFEEKECLDQQWLWDIAKLYVWHPNEVVVGRQQIGLTHLQSRLYRAELLVSKGAYRWCDSID